MTTIKRLSIAGIVAIVFGTGAAYYGTVLLMHAYGLPASVNYVVLALVAALVSLMLVGFRRNVRRGTASIVTQLESMSRSGQIGLVMVEGGNELSQIAKPLNELLTATKAQIDRIRSESREMQIQSRIAAAEKSHTEAIIFSISDAVIVTNQFDELLLANEAAQKLLGFKLEAALRKNIDRVFTDGTLVRLIRETRNHGDSAPQRTRKVVEHSLDEKGTPRTFTITLSCVCGSGTEVNGVVAVLHDVTREKEIARMKTDFVSNVSHELKTPLASIKAYVEMLVDGEAHDEKTKMEFYEIIQGETDRLHRLIENILNISRIESGVVKVVKEPISLTAVAKQALDVVVPQAKAKNIKLNDMLAPVFYQVEADYDMMYQAVLNLLSNAIKYTPEGGTVSANITVDERRGTATCDISDTGAGIPPEDLPRIFDKFYRVRANNKMAKGTGLGLTLVKHIIETVHDGKLSVTSEQGKGSTFSFELPVLK